MAFRIGRLGAALAAGAALTLAAAGAALAWGHTGHRDIGYLAIESLPSDLPQFLLVSATYATKGFSSMFTPKAA